MLTFPSLYRLNQFPEIATFVRAEGHADRYANLAVNYVEHHNPDLILFDNQDQELHRIDLTRLRTLDNVHKLMVLLGIKELCRNSNPSCDDWANTGECERNSGYMSVACRKSCGLCGVDAIIEPTACKDESPTHDCQYWATMGQCDENAAFMRVHCAKACGLCSSATSSTEESLEDELDQLGKDEL